MKLYVSLIGPRYLVGLVHAQSKNIIPERETTHHRQYSAGQSTDLFFHRMNNEYYTHASRNIHAATSYGM